ncbi:hypothetical protein D3P96_04930 [Weissella viridescens]|uniref:Uncharacterized protein n=2 Tax=Weissella viridescens TaxID=1629 RepID=A0A3P2RED5_WEIVI|nr:hypothetical protein D3P96_04930 [Weissella viridescens]
MLAIAFHGSFSRSWSTVEHEFEQCFLSARFQSSLTGHPFEVCTENNAIYVNRVKIALPPNWENYWSPRIEVRAHAITGGTLAFFNTQTKARKRLVFQVGGGTYVWR